MNNDNNITIRKKDCISQARYREAVDTLLRESLEGFIRKNLEPKLIVYEQAEKNVCRMVFFDLINMSILLVYTFDSNSSGKSEVLKNEYLLYLNYTLFYPKYGHDPDGQTDIKYAFSVDDSFSLAHLKNYMDQMEKTLQRIMN